MTTLSKFIISIGLFSFAIQVTADSPWENFSTHSLRQKLTPMQYYVTQDSGTEPAFTNSYWNNKTKGIYVDVVSGEPLFSSSNKYDSGTGWPSFTQPINKNLIMYKKNHGFFTSTTEVRSKYGNSHLGHVFNDGPAPTGLRYCINSSALKFIPLEDMEKMGYGAYIPYVK